MPFKDPNSPGAKASNKRRFARWYAKNRAHCLARMKERYRNKKAVSKQESDGRRQMKKGAKKDEATRQKMRDGSARRKALGGFAQQSARAKKLLLLPKKHG
jgi:hypothetical protein